MYYQVSCGYICKREKKSTRFVRLVLTGVRVANYFNSSYLDLNLLTKHTYNACLSVCRSVCLSVYVCSVCQSVCLYVHVCTVGMYSTECLNSRLSVHLSVSLSAFLHFCTTCLSVCLCMSVSLYFCCLYVLYI